MKIVHVIPFFAPAWGYGGPVRACFDITSQLAKNKHRVSVLTTDAYDNTRRINKVCEVFGGVKVLRFKNVSNFLAKRFNLFLPIGFKKYLREHLAEFDLVHLHAFYTYQNVLSARFCKKFKIPYVLHLHETPAPEPLLKKTLIKKVFNLFFGKNILRSAERIFVLSTSEKDRLINFLPEVKDKIVVVLAPVNLKIEKDAKQNRRKFSLKKSDKVFLFLGRLGFIKGLRRLILIFNLLSKNDSESKLIIAGPDEGEMAALKKQVKSLGLEQKVKFVGFVEGKTKDELFFSSDVFVLFSYYESFSIAALEALAHNVPVCLSRDVGVAGELEDFNCALTVNDPDNYKKSALQLKSVYDKRAKFKKNCSKALEQFKVEKIVKKINDSYLEIKPE